MREKSSIRVALLIIRGRSSAPAIRPRPRRRSDHASTVECVRLRLRTARSAGIHCARIFQGSRGRMLYRGAASARRTPHAAGALGMQDDLRQGLALFGEGWVGGGLSQVCDSNRVVSMFLRKENPALFTAINADSCEALHFLVPYDRERAERASERIVEVIAATKEGRLLERAYRDPSDFRCLSQCGHRDRCWRLP
jgi:hypothetical protein